LSARSFSSIVGALGLGLDLRSIPRIHPYTLQGMQMFTVGAWDMIWGAFALRGCTLFIDRVQGDPYASA
jgi:hypothetical protein